MSREAVALMPGIGVSGLELMPLRRRIERQGYDAHIFFYSAWHRTIEHCVGRFQRFLAQVAPGGAHLVCHSLGGLVASLFASTRTTAEPLRIVTLGTPHLGALAARNLARFSLGRSILGRDLLSALDAAPYRLPPHVEMGTIAGSLDPGLGRLWGLSQPNDGLIRVEETLHPDAADCLTVPSTHATLLISSPVTAQVVHFLAHGRFARQGGEHSSR